jgi:hypothetical protein
MRFAGMFVGILLGVIVTCCVVTFHPAEAATPLDSTAPIVVRYEDASGTPVMAPRTIPLYEYVEGSDAAISKEIHDLEYAIEADLHAKDRSFNRTHEFIDGRQW